MVLAADVVEFQQMAANVAKFQQMAENLAEFQQMAANLAEDGLVNVNSQNEMSSAPTCFLHQWSAHSYSSYL